jgi:probable phosphoglycerate mutase
MSVGSLVVHWVRHGESGWNAAGLLQGQSDVAPGLTTVGHRQAREAAAALAGSGAGVVISSDLRRAMQTATPIVSALRAPLQIEPRLRERSLGSSEGRPIAEATEGIGVIDDIVVDADAKPKGGESVRELYERVARYVDALRSGEVVTDGRPVVLVAHGGVLRVARAYLSGELPDKMSWVEVDNASIWRVAL